MAANTLNSLMPLWLYVILREKSSAQNPLSRFEIEKILTDEYYISIGEKDRNKTKRCINALCDYFAEKNSKIKKGYTPVRCIAFLLLYLTCLS